MTPPERIQAFVVGIGTYGLGPTWRLENACRYAVEFAAWLRGKGVPTPNVHLFISTPDQAVLAPRLQSLALAPRPATLAAVEDFLDHQLGNQAGDLLYLFWSGHGSVSDDSQRILFCEDVPSNGSRHVDLTHLLRRLRGSEYAQFKRQVAYVDACANQFEELGFTASAGRNQPGVTRAEPGIVQRFFFAASPGEQAREGVFSRAVVEALRKSQQWPPDHDQVVDAVRLRFEGREQRPVQMTWITEEGDAAGVETVIGDLPASDFVNASALKANFPVGFMRQLAERALSYPVLGGEDSALRRDQLYQIVAASARKAATARPTRANARLDLLRIVASAFYWNSPLALKDGIAVLESASAEFAAELDRLLLLNTLRTRVSKLSISLRDLRADYLATLKPLSSDARRDRPSTLSQMLDELSQVSGVEEPYHYLWEFLLRVASRHPKHQAGLETFVGEHTSQLFVSTVKTELKRLQRFLLSISIDPENEEVPRLRGVTAQLLAAGTANVVEPFAEMPASTWELVEEVVGGIVRQARRTVMEQFQCAEQSLQIEFLMPDAFFVKAPDEFRLLLGRRPMPIGKAHSVVIRWRERLRHPAEYPQAPWRARSATIDRNGAAPISWLQAVDCCGEFDVLGKAVQGLVVLRFVPREEFLEVIDAGFPFVAWPRSQPANADWNAFVEQLESWASQGPVESLPSRLTEIRQRSGDVGTQLTVFWDDPDYSNHWLHSDVRSV